jgi:hypothetical protein
MPYRRLPNSIPSVLRTLQVARDKYKNTPNAADRAISAEQFAKLTDTGSPESFLTRFQKEVTDVDLALAAQAPLTGDLSVKGARATMLVSHFHQVLDLAIARGVFPEGVRRYYGREVSATKGPALATQQEALEEAQKIVDGEAARAAAEGGAYVAMAMPSAVQVQEALTAYGGTLAASRAATEKTDREREEAGALYPEAQALAVDICDTVEFFYRKDPSAGSRRVKCRRWGVVYVFGEGETADPQEPGGGGAGGGGNPPQG